MENHAVPRASVGIEVASPPGVVAWALAIVLLLGSGCLGTLGDRAPETNGDVASGEAGLRLLTPSQYRSTVRDLLGQDVPVELVGQWTSSIAAAEGGVSAASVEAYEAAARSEAAYVFGDAGRREALVGCQPQASADDPCARRFLEAFGRRAWRRSLSAEELGRYAGVASRAGTSLGDAWRGLEFAVVGLLQSPNFLYRVELAEEPDPARPDRFRFSSIEMATRLSYFLVNSTPDDLLLDAAERGDLVTEDGIRVQLERLLASERAHAGAVEFFTDLLDLDALLALDKDAMWLPLFTPTIGPAMREQLRRTIEDVVFGSGDYRDLFDTRATYVNRELAALYEIDGQFGDELVPVTLPDPGPRGGILTLAGLLSMNAGQADTSPTLRGKFVRNVILCQVIPPPPPGVVTTLPEPPPDQLVTTRDLLEAHRDDPTCSGCHGMMDPIGLSLEHFDALGAFRATENGLPIDTSGDLDGMSFQDAREMGLALRAHPELSACFVRGVFRYASGHIEQMDQAQALEDLTARFLEAGYDVRKAFAAVALSEAFRFVSPSVGDGGGP